jgi:plasmid maintenance system antidote protein VapI
MTPTHLRESLTALHWSQRALATILSVDERQVRRWFSDSSPLSLGFVIACGSAVIASGVAVVIGAVLVLGWMGP